VDAWHPFVFEKEYGSEKAGKILWRVHVYPVMQEALSPAKMVEYGGQVFVPFGEPNLRDIRFVDAVCRRGISQQRTAAVGCARTDPGIRIAIVEDEKRTREELVEQPKMPVALNPFVLGCVVEVHYGCPPAQILA